MTSWIYILLACMLTCCYAIINSDRPCTSPSSDACHKCASSYELSTQYYAIPVGCYKSAGGNAENALPYDSLINYRSTIDWQQWYCDKNAKTMIAHKCGKEALKKQSKFYGIEFYGECYFANDASEIDPTNQGLVPMSGPYNCTACTYDVGGPDTMMIYKVVDITVGTGSLSDSSMLTSEGLEPSGL